MRKLPVIFLIFIINVNFIFSQDKPRLGILPFSGGTGEDGETIAILFSNERELVNNFTIIPRTSVARAINNEQDFQLSGYTDSDTVARLGRRLGVNGNPSFGQ